MSEELENLKMENQMSELDLLKAEADELGVTYSHTIGFDTLKARVDQFKAEMSKENDDTAPTKQANPIFNKSLKEDRTTVTYEPNKNIRVQISCLDPDKTAWQGETITVGNARNYIRKFVLFDKPYHVPQALLDVLKARTFTKFVTSKNKLGHDVTKTVQSPAFNIQILDKISDEEYNAIRQNQLVNGKDD